MDISATEFKARCLKLLDDVARTHEPVVVTKRGKPVARVVPIAKEPKEKRFGCMAGTISIVSDIVAPIDEPWSAVEGDEGELYEPLTVREKGREREKEG